MSLKYRDSQGNETPVAGLNGISGELVPSTAAVRKGTFTVPPKPETGISVDVLITFDTPMEDANYEVVFFTEPTWPEVILLAGDKTVNGFEAHIAYPINVPISYTVNYTAFKLMTDEVHEADSAHIAQNTANFAPAFSDVTSYAVGDYVTYNNILYRCTTAHVAGVWVAGHFTQVTVGGDLASNSTWHYITVAVAAESYVDTPVPSNYNGFYEVSVFDAKKHVFCRGVRLGTDVAIGTVRTNYAEMDNDGITLFENIIRCLRESIAGNYIVAYRPIQAVAIG